MDGVRHVSGMQPSRQDEPRARSQTARLLPVCGTTHATLGALEKQAVRQALGQRFVFAEHGQYLSLRFH